MVSTLGTGGMGVVWKAIDTRLNRPVAIKAIRDMAGSAETQAVLRLRAEALAAAALDHPYICKIYELLETEQETLVVMEFVEGETLDTILERGESAGLRDCRASVRSRNAVPMGGRPRRRGVVVRADGRQSCGDESFGHTA